MWLVGRTTKVVKTVPILKTFLLQEIERKQILDQEGNDADQAMAYFSGGKPTNDRPQRDIIDRFITISNENHTLNKSDQTLLTTFLPSFDQRLYTPGEAAALIFYSYLLRTTDRHLFEGNRTLAKMLESEGTKDDLLTLRDAMNLMQDLSHDKGGERASQQLQVLSTIIATRLDIRGLKNQPFMRENKYIINNDRIANLCKNYLLGQTNQLQLLNGIIM